MGDGAVATAMRMAMHKKGILLPPDINERRKRPRGRNRLRLLPRHARPIVCSLKQKASFFLKVPPWVTKSS